MPRGLPCASVVTVHDVMAIERPDLHLQGLERVAKRVYFRQAIWRALRQATRLVAQSKATADRICMLLPEAAARLTVIWSAPDRMPRGWPCASVVTVHDVMAIERPDLHLQGLERVAKRVYFRQAIWRALRQATRLVAQSKATADRICMLLPEAAARLTVIWSA